MEKVILRGKLVAIKITSLLAGSRPVTAEGSSLQVLTLKHKKGASVASHYHRPTKRVTRTLQECLVVLKGKIKIDFYALSPKPLKSVTLKAGEACIILGGTTSLRYVEASEVIEIKNGPFKKDIVHINRS